MTSILEYSLTAVQQENSMTIAILTVAGYDYVLTFAKEIKYIWVRYDHFGRQYISDNPQSKPWTCMSVLFVLVRYCGLYNLVIGVLYTKHKFYSTLTVPEYQVPSIVGLVKTYVLIFSLPHYHVYETYNRYLMDSCRILKVIEHWTYLLFLGAADSVMILRVWAMYNRSRIILGMLLVLFFIEIISVVTAATVYSESKNQFVVAIQGPDFTLCAGQFTPPIWSELTNISQVAFAGMLCVLVITQFVRESFQMYRVTRQWQLNCYLNLLVKQGTLYFFVIFLLNLPDLLFNMGELPVSGWGFILVTIVQFVPVFTLTPRFILSIRELHAHNVQGRCVGGIDTGFGLSARSTCGHTGIHMVSMAGGQIETEDSSEGDE